MRKITGACLLTVLLVSIGCKPDAAVRKGEVVGAGPAAFRYDAAPEPSTTGTLVGTVEFSGTPPARVAIDMSQDPACSLSGGTNLSEQYVVDHGKLANVFVYVKNAPRLQPQTTAVVENQKGCRFVPHVIGVAAGGTVQFTNSDPTMHNVHTMAVQAGNQSVDVSQAPGAAPAVLHFDKPENMIPVRCNNHPWMSAFITVSPNTFFAVTGPDGSFTILGIPQGTYTVGFVQEKLGERDVQVTVLPKTSTAVKTTYTLP